MNYYLKFMIASYIILVLLFSVSCRKIQEAPITHLYVIDLQNNVCSKRKITDKKTLASYHVADLPIESCDGNVSLTMEEFLNLRTFMKGR